MNTTHSILWSIFNKLKQEKYYVDNPTSLRALINTEANMLINRYRLLIQQTEKNKKNIHLISKYNNEIKKIEDAKEEIISRELSKMY